MPAVLIEDVVERLGDAGRGESHEHGIAAVDPPYVAGIARKPRKHWAEYGLYCDAGG